MTIKSIPSSIDNITTYPFASDLPISLFKERDRIITHLDNASALHYSFSPITKRSSMLKLVVLYGFYEYLVFTSVWKLSPTSVIIHGCWFCRSGITACALATLYCFCSQHSCWGSSIAMHVNLMSLLSLFRFLVSVNHILFKLFPFFGHNWGKHVCFFKWQVLK